jgi:hypothetical protein
MPGRRGLLAGGAAALLAGTNGRARAAGPAIVPRYVCPPVGARWSFRATGTGLMAAQQPSQSFERPPDQEFLGERYIAAKAGQDLTLLNDEGATVAILRDDKPWMRYLDPMPNYQWPMQVGAQWSGPIRVVMFSPPGIGTNHYDLKVLGWQTIAVPAGSFGAFHIASQIGSVKTERWWNPEIGLTVKIITSFRNSEGKEGQRVLELTQYLAKP